MANRTVAVELALEVNQYRRGASEARRETQAIKREITALNTEAGKQAEVWRRNTAAVEGFTRDASGRLRDARGRFVATGAQIGTDVASSMLAQVTGALGKTPPQVQAALVGGVVAASPAIGAAVSAAVLGGLSVGVVAAGVKVAFADPRVQAAGETFAAGMKARLASAWEPFVPATLDAMAIARDAIGDLDDELRLIGSRGARYVAPLARALTGLATEAAPGIADALDEAAPVIAQLEAGGRAVGRAIGDAMDAIGDGAAGAGVMVGDLLTVTAASVRALGTAVGWLSQAYSYVRIATGGDRTQVLTEMVAGEAAAQQYDTALQGLIESFRGTATAAQTAEEAIRGQLQALTDMTSAVTSGRNAMLDVEEAIDEVTTQVNKYGTSLDATTAKGRANQRFLGQWMAAIDQKAAATEQAALADGASAEAAAAAGARIRQTLMADLRRTATQAGFAGSEIDGMAAAARAADGERIRIYIDQVHRTFGKPATDYTGIGGSTFRGYSAGGPVDGGVPGRDSVPAMLMPGEYVLTRDAVRALGGPSVLDMVNQMRPGQPAAPRAVPAVAAPGGGTLVLNAHFHGPVGSRIELETWLAGALTNLQRKGRMP